MSVLGLIVLGTLSVLIIYSIMMIGMVLGVIRKPSFTFHTGLDRPTSGSSDTSQGHTSARFGDYCLIRVAACSPSDTLRHRSPSIGGFCITFVKSIPFGVIH